MRLQQPQRLTSHILGKTKDLWCVTNDKIFCAFPHLAQSLPISAAADSMRDDYEEEGELC